MKKLLLLLVLALFLTTTSFSYATDQLPRQNLKDRTSTSSKSLESTSDSQSVDNLKNRAEREITRRLNFLNDLLKRIDSAKKLSDGDKASLKNQIQVQIDSLTALQTKINGDSDLTTLKTDVRSIVSNYYIFAFFRVKINLLQALDRMSVATDNLTAISTKLEARINEAKAQGKDVSALTALHSDMNNNIDEAKTAYTEAETSLNDLLVTGFPDNRAALFALKEKITSAAKNLKEAYEDAFKIRQELKTIGGNVKDRNASGSALKN